MAPPQTGRTPTEKPSQPRLSVVQHVVLRDFLVAAEDGGDERGPDPHAVAFLPPVDGPRVVVAYSGDFQPSRERMHDYPLWIEDFEVIAGEIVVFRPVSAGAVPRLVVPFILDRKSVV